MSEQIEIILVDDSSGPAAPKPSPNQPVNQQPPSTPPSPASKPNAPSEPGKTPKRTPSPRASSGGWKDAFGLAPAIKKRFDRFVGQIEKHIGDAAKAPGRVMEGLVSKSGIGGIASRIGGGLFGGSSQGAGDNSDVVDAVEDVERAIGDLEKTLVEEMRKGAHSQATGPGQKSEPGPTLPGAHSQTTGPGQKSEPGPTLPGDRQRLPTIAPKGGAVTASTVGPKKPLPTIPFKPNALRAGTMAAGGARAGGAVAATAAGTGGAATGVGAGVGAGVGGAAAGAAAGLTALIPPVAAAVIVIGGIVVAGTMLMKFFKRQADELQEYNGAVAGARAELEAMRVEKRVERGEAIGGAVAQVEMAKLRYEEAMFELTTKIYEALVPLVPVLETGIDLMTVVVRSAEVGVEVAQDIFSALAPVTSYLVTGKTLIGEMQETNTALGKMALAVDEVFRVNGNAGGGQQYFFGHDPFNPGFVNNPFNPGRPQIPNPALGRRPGL